AAAPSPANPLPGAAAPWLRGGLVRSFAAAAVHGLPAPAAGREVALGLVALGADAPPPPPAPAILPLGLATVPPSSREVAYPLLGLAHAATALASPAEVSAARVAVPASPVDGSGIALQPLPADAVAEPIEAVILRRGSTRRVPREPVVRAELPTALRQAVQPPAPECPVTPEPSLIVHAVDGLDPGTYVLDPARFTLHPLRAGRFRGEAGHLGLGQELPADAAFNVYWLVDLERVLARQGARGYRAAQLAAAVAGGRTYLAAYALGLGATGLTLFAHH